MDDATKSLSDVAPGEVVTVSHVLFEGVRTRCAELGLREGDRVRVRMRGHDTLLIQGTDGRLVHCPKGLVRFVEVQRD